MPEHETEFFVGHDAAAPPRLARFVRRSVLALLAAIAVAALVWAAAQRPFAASQFEFGTTRVLEGRIETAPHPQLVVERPGDAGVSRWLLVAAGKHGADAQVAGPDGRRVRLEGTLIYREDVTAVELVEGSIEPLDGTSPPAGEPESLGHHALVGEIVDSKCYLGVMKPGRLKPHRACAVRCLSGGVPPLFVVRDGDGHASHLLLTGADGRQVNDEILDRVAEPLHIEGEVLRYDDLLVLRADPGSYTRLDEAARSGSP